MNETTFGETNTREKVFEKARHTGDILLRLVTENANGLDWNIGRDNGIIGNQFKENFGMDGGIIGIIGYLADLYSVTRYDKYLDAAITGMKRVLCCYDHSHNYSFYTGKGGVIYVLSKLYAITGDATYVDEAINLVRYSVDTFLNDEYIPDDLYNGRAGILMALLHLFNVSESNEVLQAIKEYAVTIIKSAFSFRNGLHWRSKTDLCMRPLCSFGHGAAGIAHVFSELGYYFKNEGFNWVAMQAFAYVNGCWSNELNNWPDFRKEITDEATYYQYLKKYSDIGASFFETPDDTIGWRHGAIGVAWSILRACRLGGALLSHDHVEEALAKIESRVEEGSDTGDWEAGILFNEAYKVTGNRKYLDIVKRLLQKAVDETLGAATSEKGGVHVDSITKAYFFLYISQPDANIPNFLLPSIERINDGPADIDISKQQIAKLLLNKYFFRTIAVLENIDANSLSVFWDAIHKNDWLTRSFCLFIDKRITELNRPPAFLKEVFMLESASMDIIYASLNASLLYMKKVVHYDYCIEQLNKGDQWLLQQTLQIPRNIKIIPLNWNWRTGTQYKNNPAAITENINAIPGKYGVILTSDVKEGVMETALDVVGLILNRFASPRAVNVALSEIIFFCQSQTHEALKPVILHSNSRDRNELIKRLPFIVLYQVKQLICDGILAFSKR